MQYFTKDFIQYFKDLEKNNNKTWFQENKKRYETDVKKPMLKLVTDVVDNLKKLDPEITMEPKKCIGRINRDIRFSNDKTPYKIRTFARIFKGDKADPLPVIAFQMGAYDFGIMSGFYKPSKERLQLIKENIMRNPARFQELYAAKEFKEYFGAIQGEAYKRIPKEHKATFETEPLIANKQFFYVKEFEPDLLLSEDLLPLIIDSWKAARPLNEFLT